MSTKQFDKYPEQPDASDAQERYEDVHPKELEQAMTHPTPMTDYVDSFATAEEPWHDLAHLLEGGLLPAAQDRIAALEAKLGSALNTCVLATEAGLTETGRLVDKIQKDAEAKRREDVRKCEEICKAMKATVVELMPGGVALDFVHLGNTACANAIRAAFKEVFQDER